MPQTLTDRLRAYYGAGDQSRGGEVYRGGKIRLVHAGVRGVLAKVAGSGGEQYHTGIDLRHLPAGEVRIVCDCPRFADGYPCKHTWAVMLATEAAYDFDALFQTVGIAATKSLSLAEGDEDELDYGTPLHSRPTPQAAAREEILKRPDVQKILARIRSGQNTLAEFRDGVTGNWQGNGLGNGRAGDEVKRAGDEVKPLDWRSALGVLEFDQPEPWPGRVTTKLTQAARPVRHNFDIQIGEQNSAEPLRVRVLRQRPLKSGEWGATTEVAYRPAMWHDFERADEKPIFGAVVNQADDDFYGDWDNPVIHRLTFRPDRLTDAVDAMIATGRATLSGDQQQRPLAWHRPPPQSIAMRLQIDPIAPADRRRKVREVAVTPSLTVGDELIDMDALGFLTADGIAELGGGLVIFSPAAAAAIARWRQIKSIVAPVDSIDEVLAKLAATQGQLPLTIDESLGVAAVHHPPTPRLHLDTPASAMADHLTARVEMIYDNHAVDASDPRTWDFDAEGQRIIHRDAAAESERIDQLPIDVLMPGDSPGSLQLPRSRFAGVVAELVEAGWEVVADGIRTRVGGEFDIAVSSGIDWFDVTAQATFGDTTVGLPELLAALKKGSGVVLLDDGSQGMLPQAWIDRIERLGEVGTVDGDGVRFHHAQALLLDELLAQQEVDRDQSFVDFCRRLRDFDGIEPGQPPPGFVGQLRDYQKLSLGWFAFLREFRFGGCLADDMGLGKTVQVLAMLADRKAAGSQNPCLVVAPKSVLSNWVAEANRFAPDLTAIEYHGPDRKTKLAEPYDVLVTTYATMRNDIQLLRETRFDYAILDEAQAIKNQQSLANKAARLIPADHRLAMTGTPVENHLGDLWSLFEFLNPGMLGRLPKTVRLDREEDVEKVTAISRSLGPFILRRTKEEVLTELPEKTEQTLVYDMTTAQAKLYKELRDHYRKNLTQKVKKEGLAKSKIHVLEALLRLRQCACDPRLIDAKSKTTGVKIDMLIEQLAELIDAGHKALVFSQFTSMLALVRPAIERAGWQYEYLDGQTNHRGQHVDRFQSDSDCKIFLISLKAGGSGLNLTAADYVFILDPWWNPAVEAQAIDRAHRIGQSNPVTAYRMICKDTVEEKIIEMQANKRDLAEAIISQDQSLISRLSVEDLQELLA